jgi:hypothetical protein
MRTLAIAAVIASVACKREETVAARPDPVTKKESRPAAIVISRKAPPIGLRVREEKELEFSFEFEIGTTKTASSHAESATLVEEVLGVDGLRVTKLRVIYEARSETDGVSGGSKTKRSSPVVGKTYIVDLADAGVGITDPKGKRPPPDELAIVEKDYRSFADDDVMARGIPDTPLRVGDSVPSLANALRERAIRQGSPANSETNVDVKVDSLVSGGGEVVFKMNATFALGSAGITVPMIGTMNVRVADGFISAFAMDGELKMTGDVGVPFTGGNGKTKLSAKRTIL